MALLLSLILIGLTSTNIEMSKSLPLMGIRALSDLSCASSVTVSAHMLTSLVGNVSNYPSNSDFSSGFNKSFVAPIFVSNTLNNSFISIPIPCISYMQTTS